MCWGQTRDLAPLSQPQKTGPLIHLADSPELQGMEDQSLDLGPAPPADGLRDAPQRDRCSEDRELGRRLWTRKKTMEEDLGSKISHED